MDIVDRLGDLPKSGPFRLRGSFLPRQLMKGFFLVLLLGGLGGGFGYYGAYLITQLTEMSYVWKHGKKAYALGYRGKVRTTNVLLKSYDLKVHYRTLNGERFIKQVEFFRFLTGPGKGDTYTVRYLKKEPKRIAFSWAYEARYHGWSFALFMLGIACLFLWSLYALGREFLSNTFRVKRLARKGQLVAATINEVQTIPNPQTGKTEYLYLFSYERERTYDAEFKVTDESEHPLLLHDGAKMVLLAPQTGKEFWVLRHDGYPLVL